MSKDLQKALMLYKQRQLSKAAKLLLKDKHPCKESLKLLMMIEFDSKNYVKAIHTGEKLLSKTSEFQYIKDAYNTLRICSQHIKDTKMELIYTEKSFLHDKTEKNVQAIYQLLILYFHDRKFAKVEKLAEILTQWQVCRAAVSFILIEVAAKQGNKKLLIERLHKATDYFDEFNLKQMGVIIDFYIETDFFQLADTALKHIVQKFGCDATHLKIALLLGQKDTKGAEQYCLNYKHLLEPHAALYFEAKFALSQKNYNKEYLALTRAAEAKKKADRKGKKQKNRIDLISQFNISLPKLAKRISTDIDDYGSNYTFIMGFPRSGTTLLDSILDTQSNILVMSETSILTHLIKTFSTFKNYPFDIYKLTKEEIISLRQGYLEHIKEQGYQLPKSNIYIEKDPHLTEAIPFIKTIFPTAKIIIALRHPLDVCMSCFQTHLKSNYQNDQLVSMEDIVARYIKVFTLLEKYQNELSIKPYFIRYEDLVTDIKVETDKVFDYIDITPVDNYLLFHKHADKKFVISASRGQTNQPLYQSSINKWRNYQEHLTPHTQKLRYFIEKFGYDL